MISFITLPSAVAVATLSLLAIGEGTTWAANAGRVIQPSVQAEDPNVRCAANRATSIAIPFERIYPQAERVPPAENYVYVRGPRIFTVVTDSTMWPAVWHAAVDSVTTAPVAFDEGVVIIAATQTYPRGPIGLAIVSIRLCRATGVIVVATVEKRHGPVVTLLRSRGVDVVRASGRAFAERTVLFDQRVEFLP